MKPIKRSLSPQTKAAITSAMTESARKYHRIGYDLAWPRGFRVGALLAFAAASLLWGVVVLVVVLAR